MKRNSGMPPVEKPKHERKRAVARRITNKARRQMQSKTCCGHWNQTGHQLCRPCRHKDSFRPICIRGGWRLATPGCERCFFRVLNIWNSLSIGVCCGHELPDRYDESEFCLANPQRLRQDGAGVNDFAAAKSPAWLSASADEEAT